MAELRRRRERRRRWLWALLLLLLLPAARWCRCQEAEPPAPLAEAPEPAPPTGPSASAPVPVVTERIAARPRPAFVIPPPPARPWVEALRVQVAARGPRLAACFVGAARPGALRWTAALDPVGGVLSERALEVVGAGAAELTEAQRTCVLAVLGDPPFQLDAAAAPSTPVRVAMVLEF